MTEKLRAALQELVALIDIKARYATVRPDSPRHPQWRQYLDDTQDFPDRWIHALANARTVLASPDMEQRAGFVMVPPDDSESLRLAVRAVKQTLFRGGSGVSLPADSWIERAFIAGMLAAAGASPQVEQTGERED